MECSICIEIIPDELIFKCNACKYINCINCHKKYLLTSNQDPHCINCRAVISYDIFIDKFNEKWIFDKYKKHRYEILWEKEKSLIPETVHFIAMKKQENILFQKKFQLEEDHKKKIEEEFGSKKKELSQQLNQIYEKIYQKDRILNNEIRKIEGEILLLNPDNLNTKTISNKFKYIYTCPRQTCKGFLNEKYVCEICDITVCKKCYTEIDQNLKGPHECNPELVETFNAIKKEAKPCPSCGEFISKVSGCDQMFCITCGTAFSWKSGFIEKGIIHNPHAHTFFQNNPGAQQNYNNAQNNGCRPPIPSHTLFLNINKKIYNEDSIYLMDVHRRLSEFRQYNRERYTIFINSNNEKNRDIRIKYIKNEIDEKSFKQTLHLRDKKIYFKKQLITIILFAYEIAELLLWNIVDSQNDKNIINTNIQLLKNLNEDTNKNIDILCTKFNYKNTYLIEQYYIQCVGNI